MFCVKSYRILRFVTVCAGHYLFWRSTLTPILASPLETFAIL